MSSAFMPSLQRDINTKNSLDNSPGKPLQSTNYMKNSPLPMILLVVLAASALLSLALCWAGIGRSRELGVLRFDTNIIQTKRQIGGGLAADALEYSKTHPDYIPILEAAGLKPKSGVNTNKPANK